MKYSIYNYSKARDSDNAQNWKTRTEPHGAIAHSMKANMYLPLAGIILTPSVVNQSTFHTSQGAKVAKAEK